MSGLRSPRITGLAVLAAAALLAFGPAASAADKPAAPDVDVVLCLDVSGSMNGLIDSAKIKLWDIVNDLGKVKPTPNLRVGLYSYGHNTYPAARGWVRKDADLTTDLDEVYKKLNALTINGGTELVARVTRDAIAEQKWSTQKKALKLIFVCGNEPADQDKQVHLKDVAKTALDRDIIIINTIYCGPATHPEAQGWRDYARMCEGRFASIDMNRGTVAIATPQDKKLAELSGKLNSTYVAYGRAEQRKAKAENQVAQDRNAAKAPGAAATRALSKSGGLYRNSDWDLVDRLTDDPKFDITKVPEDQLCDELKKLKPAERVKYVKEKLAQRQALRKEIAELSKQRADYVRQEMKKHARKGDQAFDDAVRSTVREQARKKGIKVPE